MMESISHDESSASSKEAVKLMWRILNLSRPGIRIAIGVSCLVLCSHSLHPTLAEEKDSGEKKAREAIARGIEAMGGDAFRNIRNAEVVGRYFIFIKGRKGFARYHDWTVYDPVKSRFQLGKGDNQEVSIFNLELGKAWKLKGDYELKELKKKDIKAWKKAVNRHWSFLLKSRIDEEGMSLFYYGPDDVAGEGKWEAVEFLDPTNASSVVFFDLETHLPQKIESEVTDSKSGVRYKEEVEISNWHTIDGVYTPLREDVYRDGEMARQTHIEEIHYNVNIPPEYFLKPVVKEE